MYCCFQVSSSESGWLNDLHQFLQSKLYEVSFTTPAGPQGLQSQDSCFMGASPVDECKSEGMGVPLTGVQVCHWCDCCMQWCSVGVLHCQWCLTWMFDIIQTLPFMLKNFLSEEVAIINNHLHEVGAHEEVVTDPSNAMTFVLCSFLQWYNMVRQPIISTEALKIVANQTYNLLNIFKTIFPQKAGLKCLCTPVYSCVQLELIVHSCVLLCTILCTCWNWYSAWAGGSQGWRIIKFHMISHILNHMILFGWIENSSCQAGEHCHKFYIKILKRLTNNKQDWEKQIFKIHAREQGDVCFVLLTVSYDVLCFHCHCGADIICNCWMNWTGLQNIIGEVQESIMTEEQEEEFMLDDLFVPERKKVLVVLLSRVQGRRYMLCVVYYVCTCCVLCMSCVLVVCCVCAFCMYCCVLMCMSMCTLVYSWGCADNMSLILTGF